MGAGFCLAKAGKPLGDLLDIGQYGRHGRTSFGYRFSPDAVAGLFSLYHMALRFVQHSESFSAVERYSLCSFNSRELVTTETELNAIAVPASTGLNSPNAARGTPMVL